MVSGIYGSRGVRQSAVVRLRLYRSLEKAVQRMREIKGNSMKYGNGHFRSFSDLVCARRIL